MYMPAEYYNENYRSKNDDYEGFTFGDESSEEDEDDYDRKPIERPKSPPLDNIRLLDDRLYSSIMYDDTDKLDNLLAIHVKRKSFSIDVPLQSGYCMLMSACQNAQYDIVEILLKHGANPNVHVELHSPIMDACKSITNMSNSLRIVEKLIEIGVSVNQSNRCGTTPLMFACASGNIDVVKCLMKYADLNMVDNQGNTALFHAVENNKVDVVRLLLSENKVQTKLTNVAGYTPKQLAMFGGFEEMVELFPNEKLYTIPSDYLTNNHYTDMAPTLFYQHKKPAYFMDVRALLNGMECDKFLPKFAQTGIGLAELLNINDDRLNEIGISMPFQKNRIYLGLWRFHQYQWSPWTVKSVTQKAKEFSNVYDIYCLIAGHLRYIIVLRESLRYVCENITKRGQGMITEEIAEQLEFLSSEIQQMLAVIIKFKKRIQYFEKFETPKPPLYIEDVQCSTVSASCIGKMLKTFLKCSTFAMGFASLFLYLKRR